MIAEGSDPYGAIFEDDICFSHDAKSFIEDSDWIKGDVDIIKLNIGPWVKGYGPKMLLGEKIASFSGGRYLAPLLEVQYGLQGYIVSRNFAKRFYDLMEEPCIMADVLFFDPVIGFLKQLNVLQVFPAIVREKDLASCLDPFRNPVPRPTTLWGRQKRKLIRFFKKHAIRARLLNIGKVSFWGRGFYKE